MKVEQRSRIEGKSRRLENLQRKHEALMVSHDGWLFCRCQVAEAIRALTQEVMADVQREMLREYRTTATPDRARLLLAELTRG